MKSYDGYLKRKLGDSYVNLTNGGHKSLGDFLGSILWDSTNKKIQYKSSNANSWSDLLSFGDRAFDSTSYLPLTGGTISNNVDIPLSLNNTTTSGNSWLYFKINDVRKAGVGYISLSGALLANETTGYRITIGDDNAFTYYNGTSNVILHSGNYQSYLGYIGTTAVQSQSAVLNLTGIGNISIKDAGYITTGDDRFIYHHADSSTPANNLTILASGIKNAGKVLIRPYNMDNDSYSTTFLSSGNVGIGITNPGARLDVAGNIRAISSLSSADWSHRIMAGDSHTGTIFLGTYYSTYSSPVTLPPGIYSHTNDLNHWYDLGIGAGGSIRFYLSHSEIGRWNDIGLGIGLDPSYKLDVNGAILGKGFVYIKSTDATEGGEVVLLHNSNSTYNVHLDQFNAGSVPLFRMWSAETTYFNINCSNGNVSIGDGSNTSAYKLNVNGNVRVAKTLYVDGDDAYGGTEGGEIVLKNVYNSSYHAHFDVYSNLLRVWSNGIARFSLDLTNGNLTCTNFYTSSDIKKKTNINKISRLLPIVEFDWKESGEHSYGFIAQELESLGYLELVNGLEEKTVNYNAALSLCVAQLSNIVEDNKLKIKELEAKILELERRIT